MLLGSDMQFKMSISGLAMAMIAIAGTLPLTSCLMDESGFTSMGGGMPAYHQYEGGYYRGDYSGYNHRNDDGDDDDGGAAPLESSNAVPVNPGEGGTAAPLM
jgi:hypothetical protein